MDLSSEGIKKVDVILSFKSIWKTKYNWGKGCNSILWAINFGQLQKCFTYMGELFRFLLSPRRVGMPRVTVGPRILFLSYQQGKLTMKWKWKSLSHVQLCDPYGLYSPWNSPGQNTGVGSLFLLQGIFPTQGSNPGLPHCRQILYQLSHKGQKYKVQSEVTQSCPTLFDPMDCVLWGSSVPGIFQARVLECIVIATREAQS